MILSPDVQSRAQRNIMKWGCPYLQFYWTIDRFQTKRTRWIRTAIDLLDPNDHKSMYQPRGYQSYTRRVVSSRKQHFPFHSPNLLSKKISSKSP